MACAVFRLLRPDSYRFRPRPAEVMITIEILVVDMLDKLGPADHLPLGLPFSRDKNMCFR